MLGGVILSAVMVLPEMMSTPVPAWQACLFSAVIGVALFLYTKKSTKNVDVKQKDDSEQEEGEEPGSVQDKWGIIDGPYKMVLCVNMELSMGKGKVAAQCCHATLGAFKIAKKHCPSAIKYWEMLGQAKIAVKVPTEKEMMDLMNQASTAGLVTYMVQDAGRTQIPAGSRTVLAIGPAPVSAFEPITSHLKLL